ncbi:MAG: hypothetical protein U1F43_06230 [Myxococcota bacterium]
MSPAFSASTRSMTAVTAPSWNQNSVPRLKPSSASAALGKRSSQVAYSSAPSAPAQLSVTTGAGRSLARHEPFSAHALWLASVAASWPATKRDGGRRGLGRGRVELAAGRVAERRAQRPGGLHGDVVVGGIDLVGHRPRRLEVALARQARGDLRRRARARPRHQGLALGRGDVEQLQRLGQRVLIAGPVAGVGGQRRGRSQGPIEALRARRRRALAPVRAVVDAAIVASILVAVLVEDHDEDAVCRVGLETGRRHDAVELADLGGPARARRAEGHVHPHRAALLLVHAHDRIAAPVVVEVDQRHDVEARLGGPLHPVGHGHAVHLGEGADGRRSDGQHPPVAGAVAAVLRAVLRIGAVDLSAHDDAGGIHAAVSEVGLVVGAEARMQRLGEPGRDALGQRRALLGVGPHARPEREQVGVRLAFGRLGLELLRPARGERLELVGERRERGALGLRRRVGCGCGARVGGDRRRRVVGRRRGDRVGR